MTRLYNDKGDTKRVLCDRKWWVYVLVTETPVWHQGAQRNLHYVGATNHPTRRLLQHNKLISGGGHWTSNYPSWIAGALYGPYDGRAEAQSAEKALKSLYSYQKLNWKPEHSPLMRGLGKNDPWVKAMNKAPIDDKGFKLYPVEPRFEETMAPCDHLSFKICPKDWHVALPGSDESVKGLCIVNTPKKSVFYYDGGFYDIFHKNTAQEETSNE